MESGLARLNDLERRAVQEGLEAVRREFAVRRVVLFGSKARGDWDAESDIDLLILTDRALTTRERDRISDLLSATSAKYDMVLSALVVAEDAWETGPYSVLPIHFEVAEQGVLL